MNDETADGASCVSRVDAGETINAHWRLIASVSRARARRLGIDPDDVAQDAAVSLLAGGIPRHVGSPRGYVANAVGRRALMRFKSDFARRRRERGKARRESVATRADLVMDVRDAVAALSPKLREAVTAAYWLGESDAETAARLGISPSAVRVRRFEARALLRVKLAAYGPEE